MRKWGRLAGVAASEWSWGALLFDMDNDGLKDIFIANGIYKDLLDRTYLTYAGVKENVRKIIREEKNPIIKLIGRMPSSSFPNYAFRNKGDLHFSNVAEEWGLGVPMYSSGSAYGDLDNDGDLDLVVSNVNSPSEIYRNDSDSSRFKSIDIWLSSNSKNRFAVGTQITAFCNGKTYTADNYVTRGYQSSVQPRAHLGLGKEIQIVDSILIQWPDKGTSVLYHVPVNKQLKINQDSIEKLVPAKFSICKTNEVPLVRITNNLFKHNGSGLVDFNRERLLPMMYSNEIPAIIKGDVDKNGVDELYIGGGKDQPGKFIRYKSGKFVSSASPAMDKYSLAEETQGTFFDADGDGDLDFYMATGGRFFPKESSALQDRIFINDGKGNFTESPDALPFKDFSRPVLPNRSTSIMMVMWIWWLAIEVKLSITDLAEKVTCLKTMAKVCSGMLLSKMPLCSPLWA